MTTQPSLFYEKVFENKDIILLKTCVWPNCSVWQDGETNILKVLLPGGSSFNINCRATFALPDGERAIECDFDYLDSFHEGMAKIAIAGRGYGFIDKNMNLVIEPKYVMANAFRNGFAVVSILDENTNSDKWLFVDTCGNEYYFNDSYNNPIDYAVVYDNSEGFFRVSNLDIGGFWGFRNFAYHSDYCINAGILGYADSTGREIVTPQYIYAFDYKDGLALVCKGEWTKDKKWNNEHNSGRYWTETEQWGMIDKFGFEVVPCKFDEIKFFYDETMYFMAHYGGWENGKWGVINRTGEWVVEPVFEDLDYDMHNQDLIIFYQEDKWADPDNVPMGIYSIKDKKVIFEPKFFYIDFNDDETLTVEILDKKLNRKLKTIINLDGSSVIDSYYSNIYIYGNYYKVTITDDNGKRHDGLLDKQGNEILPCKYDIAWAGLMLDKQLIIFQVDNKCGLVDFDDNIIIEPIYTSIININNEMLEVTLGGKSGLIAEGRFGLLTLQGDIILPIIYKSISIHNDLIITREDDGSTLYRIIKTDSYFSSE
jgi:hypothetical protein